MGGRQARAFSRPTSSRVAGILRPLRLQRLGDTAGVGDRLGLRLADHAAVPGHLRRPGRYDWPEEARRLHLSHSHFRRRFKRHTGQAPQAYLLPWRMRRAAELLREPGAQVQAVAARLGYDDPAQFSRLFKQKPGLSPRAYQILSGGDAAGRG